MSEQNAEALAADHPLSQALDAEVAKSMEGVATPDEPDEPLIDTVYVVGDDDQVRTSDELLLDMMENSPSDERWAKLKTSEGDGIRGVRAVSKTVQGSTQSEKELYACGIDMYNAVPPPYSPEFMQSIFDVDPTHFSCVESKVSDSVQRGYVIKPSLPIIPYGEKPEKGSPPSVSQEAVDNEVTMIENFIDTCNERMGFVGVLTRACMDHESIGWAAIEVIRGKDKTIKKIAHIPASRIRVLEGFKGFVEIQEGGKFIYYQNFGDKVVKKDGTPMEPGDDPRQGDWAMINRKNGKASSSFNQSANEVLWIPKHHNGSIYYGKSDIVPAIGDVIGNVNIRDYMLQFFEHNTVPRYAVIVNGAKMGGEAINQIREYFRSSVKGQAHKTLLIPLPSIKGEASITFEKLDADEKEGSFQNTRKNNAANIMTAHRVSPAIIGISENSELGSGKGLSQAEIYKDRIVTPLQAQWARQLNLMFQLGLGVSEVKLQFIPLDIRDNQAEMLIYTGYLDRGVLSINEVRKMARLGGPIPGGDRYYIATTGGIEFIDQMTDAEGAEKQRLEDEINMLKESSAIRASAQSGGGKITRPPSAHARNDGDASSRAKE